MQNRSDLSNANIWGLASVVGVSALALFSVLRSRQTQPSNQICSTVASQAPLRDRLDLITRAMQRYGAFINEADNDRNVISKCIREYYSEASELSKRLDASKKHSDVSIKGITYFQSEKSQSSRESYSTHSELLAAYHELVKTYPKGEFQTWTTTEERRRITVSLVEEAHLNYEEHHQKVLDVARELLGDLDATVRLAGNRIANVVENRLN